MALQRDPVIRTREEGRKVHKSLALRAFLFFCFQGCLWLLLAIWMEPWLSTTCPRRHSGTSVSTRYDVWGFVPTQRAVVLAMR